MYRKELVETYETSGSSLPIHDWVNLIGKKMSRFSTPSDIYAPIPVYVKLSGSVNEPKGTVKLFVDATNPEWYKQLTNTLQKMTSINGNVEITNMLGKSIKDFTPTQLYAAGECDLRKSNEVVRVKSFAAPPAKMLGNKHQALTTWWRNNTDALAKRIASELKGKSHLQLENACNVDGPVQKIIENHLSNNTIDGQSWDNFMENYSNGKTNLRDLSQKILHTFRIGMSQNEQNIHDYYALSESINNNNNNSGQKMFKKSSVVAHSIYTNDLVMFQDIAEDALRLPVLENAIVNGIRYGTIKNRPQQQQQSIPKPKTESTAAAAGAATFHPLQTYYQTYHYNRHGKLPGHIMSQYNKNAGVVYKDFPGDAENTINAFLTFSGRNILIGGKAKRRKHHWFHNKKKQQKKRYDDTEQQILSKLVPIEDKIDQKALPNLIDVRDQHDKILSKLVPIEGHHHHRKKQQQQDDDHDDYGIGQKAMPDLIDIGDDYDEISSKLEPIECHHNNDDEEGMYLEGEVDNIDKMVFRRRPRKYRLEKEGETYITTLTDSQKKKKEADGWTVTPQKTKKSRFLPSRDEVSSAADMTIGCHHNDSDDDEAGIYLEGEVDNIDLNIFRKKKRLYNVQKKDLPTKQIMLTDKEKRDYENDGFTVKLARRKGRWFAGDEAPAVPIPTDKELSEPLWKKKLPTLAELLASPLNN